MVTAKLQIINGVGPEWFPTTLRNKLTKFSLMFFDADSWEHHDEAYTKGGGLYSKFKADFNNGTGIPCCSIVTVVK